MNPQSDIFREALEPASKFLAYCEEAQKSCARQMIRRSRRELIFSIIEDVCLLAVLISVIALFGFGIGETLGYVAFVGAFPVYLIIRHSLELGGNRQRHRDLEELRGITNHIRQFVDTVTAGNSSILDLQNQNGNLPLGTNWRLRIDEIQRNFEKAGSLNLEVIHWIGWGIHTVAGCVWTYVVSSFIRTWWPVVDPMEKLGIAHKEMTLYIALLILTLISYLVAAHFLAQEVDEYFTMGSIAVFLFFPLVFLAFSALIAALFYVAYFIYAYIKIISIALFIFLILFVVIGLYTVFRNLS